VFETFKTKQVDEFADSIIAELRERHPPERARPARPKDIERVQKLFGRIFLRIDSFVSEHRLNLYTKARFANRIRWGLKEAGYADDFVETATREVATHAALATRAAKRQKKA
jgi:hypothetical protein